MSGKIEYRHHGTGVLRASVSPTVPSRWPALDDQRSCRSWLCSVWPHVAPPIRHASTELASHVDAIIGGRAMSARSVRRTTLAVVRYVLRYGRSTPFGLFAGVSAVSVEPPGRTATVRFGKAHRPVVRPDNRCLRELVDRLEACLDLLTQLDVVFTDAAQVTGERLTLLGADLVSVRNSPAVALVRERAATPVRYAALVDSVAVAFPAAGDPSRLLRGLLSNGFLVSSLRAPNTVVDPLGFLVARLAELNTDGLSVEPLVTHLERLHKAVLDHNDEPGEVERQMLSASLRMLVNSVRDPLAVDLRLDADVRVPASVAHEMERAATVLARLVREHTGSRPWRDYFAAFCERYGTGTLVPLSTVIDPGEGLGWPRGYPDSPEPSGRHVLSERDRRLFALAADATARGVHEVVLDDTTLAELVQADGEPDTIPQHLDLGAHIGASSLEALDRGDFTVTVAPGRAAGTLTSRFTPLLPEDGLPAVFGALPTTIADAIPAQLSFSPLFPSGENVARVPRYMSTVLPVGEHLAYDEDAISVDDLAVTATTRRLHLVSLSRRRVVEPLVMHALALKQQPPLARFLGELPRALDGNWIGFDWGAADTLPFLPRLRHGRSVLCAARWRLTRANLGIAATDAAASDRALTRWRRTWRCPTRVELRDFDQHLPLDLDVAAHRAIVYRHLHSHDAAVLIEAAEPDANGWLDGHAHTVVLPMTSRRAPLAGPRVDLTPELTRSHGHLPGSASAGWVYGKLYVSEHRMNDILVADLPALLNHLGRRPWWFVRFPQAREGDEADHLRLRLRAGFDLALVLFTLTRWADELRAAGRVSRLALDTYYPETGRYLAIADAEAMFAADSRFVLALLNHERDLPASPRALAALSLFDVADAFLDGRDRAADWLHTQAPSAVPDRGDVAEVVRLARAGGWDALQCLPDVADAYRQRRAAVRAYRRALPPGADTDAALHSVLHMHHNRLLGVDRDREAVCLRLARQAAATMRACRTVTA